MIRKEYTDKMYVSTLELISAYTSKGFLEIEMWMDFFDKRLPSESQYRLFFEEIRVNLINNQEKHEYFNFLDIKFSRFKEQYFQLWSTIKENSILDLIRKKKELTRFENYTYKFWEHLHIIYWNISLIKKEHGIKTTNFKIKDEQGLKEILDSDKLQTFIEIEKELFERKFIDEKYSWQKDKQELCLLLHILVKNRFFKPVVKGDRKTEKHYRWLISERYGLGKLGLSNSWKNTKTKERLKNSKEWFKWLYDDFLDKNAI